MSAVLPCLVFLLTGGLVLLFTVLERGRVDRLNYRLRDLAQPGGEGGARPEGKTPQSPAAVVRLARSALPKMAASLLPEEEEQRNRLRTQLLQAGLYGRQALPVFLAVKLVLMIFPWLVGLAVGLTGKVVLLYAVAGGAFVGSLGMLAPTFWLARRKARRQSQLRRALPDVLDVLVICLEGGLSLAAAFQRVAAEFRKARTLLGLELTIVQRELQLGRSLGKALRHLGLRSDLEEVDTLATLIEQTERFGTGLVKALRTHAETLRFKHLQRTEEQAQKLGGKILFPLLLFIFPAIFVIILGPAAIQVRGVLNKMNESNRNAVRQQE